MNRSMNAVPSRRFTATKGSTSIQVLVHKLPSRRRSNINPSSGSGHFVAARKVWRLSRSIKFFYLIGFNNEWMRLTTTPVSKTQAVVCMTAVAGPKNTRSLYAGFVIISTLSLSSENYNGFAIYILIFSFVPVLRGGLSRNIS